MIKLEIKNGIEPEDFDDTTATRRRAEIYLIPSFSTCNSSKTTPGPVAPARVINYQRNYVTSIILPDLIREESNRKMQLHLHDCKAVLASLIFFPRLSGTL